MHPVEIRTYHFYGRKSHPEPLAFVGQLQTGAPSDLKEDALKQFGDSGWVELIGFPETSLVRVIPAGGQR